MTITTVTFPWFGRGHVLLLNWPKWYSTYTQVWIITPFFCYAVGNLLYTMFVQVFETFSALNDFWLTTPSKPLEFFTARSSFFSSIQLPTFFCCKCIVFAVGGVPMLRVQKYQEIETMTLADVWWQFGRWMSRKCHIFQAVWKQNLVFCPSWKQSFISLSINLYTNFSMSYKCTCKSLE